MADFPLTPYLPAVRSFETLIFVGGKATEISMKRLLSLLLLIVLTFGLFVSCSSDKTEKNSETAAESVAPTIVAEKLSNSQIDKLTKKYNDRLYNFDFEGVCYVTERNKVIYNKSVSYADKKKKIKNTEKTIFRIASITKQFTAAAIMLLQERGQLSVSDKLSKYFPDYKYGKKITLENMLRMRSGIPEYLSEDMYSTVLNKKIIYKNSAKENRKFFEKRILSEKLRFKPDEKFEYSNSNYLLLGEIIEKVSGTTYHKFIKKEIFDKLNMTSSDFIDNVDSYKGNVAKPYNGTEDELKLFKIKGSAFACGDIISNAVDLTKWADGLRTYKIISEKSLKAMTEPKSNYGYGLYIMTGGNAVYHAGSFPPYCSMLLFSLEDTTEYTCVVLSNYGLKTVGDISLKLSSDYAKCITGKNI